MRQRRRRPQWPYPDDGAEDALRDEHWPTFYPGLDTSLMLGLLGFIALMVAIALGL